MAIDQQALTEDVTRQSVLVVPDPQLSVVKEGGGKQSRGRWLWPVASGPLTSRREVCFVL